jgi:excisionase family DNA binding protein
VVQLLLAAYYILVLLHKQLETEMHNNIRSILSTQEVAARLGVHVTTLYRWCAAGSFVPKVRLGPGRVGFASDDINGWLAQRRAEAVVVLRDHDNAI